MAQPDIVGMFTGISSKPLDPSEIAGKDLTRSVLGMFGKETREVKQQRQVADLIGNFDTMQPAQQRQIIAQLQAVGQTALAGQLAALAQAKATNVAADRRREGLITQATGLGLSTTAELLRTGGSMDEAAKQIRSQEEKQLVAKQGRKGKVALARSRDAGDTMIKSIATGEYDSLSNEDFLKVINGQKAELKVYTDKSGKAKPFRVNESGRVYNKDTEKWVMPSELGLTQAALLTKTITDADRISSKLKDKATENFLAANEKALGAQKVLEINANSRSLMEEGIITGAGANFLLGMASIGVQLGLVPQGIEDDLVATQTFMAERGKQVLALLGSGDVGAGTGISDKDVQFMKEVAGQQITLNKETLSRIMRIEEQVARATIAKSNSRLEVMKQYVGEDQDSALLDTFFVPMPEPSVTGYVPTQAAQTYLEQARNRRTQQPPQ